MQHFSQLKRWTIASRAGPQPAISLLNLKFNPFSFLFSFFFCWRRWPQRFLSLSLVCPWAVPGSAMQWWKNIFFPASTTALTTARQIIFTNYIRSHANCAGKTNKGGHVWSNILADTLHTSDTQDSEIWQQSKVWIYCQIILSIRLTKLLKS